MNDRDTNALDAAGDRTARLERAKEQARLEAARRRSDASERQAGKAREVDGRGGKEPTRYGDWEVKGLASDF